MGGAAKQDSAIDVDLVAAQFDVLDSDTHKKALLEAIRAAHRCGRRSRTGSHSAHTRQSW
jgi:hypothetical protein